MKAENSEYNFSLAECGSATRMVALGVGGMGSNAIGNLARAEIAGLELYSINTDRQALAHCLGSQPVQIGAKRTGGKGAGGNSEIGRLSAEDDAEKIRALIKGAELVFLASGMGGGTGTGAAPVIAKLCREQGVLCVATVTMPMSCEGSKRNKKARAGLEELRQQVDSLLIIENENLLAVMGEEDVSIREAFLRADEVLVKSVRAIARIISAHGYINLDLADLRNILQRGNGEKGVDAFIGVGEAAGEERAVRAAELALSNPLLRQIEISGAANLLVNVAGSEDLGQREAMQAVKFVVDRAGDLEREIFMGVVTDNSLGESLSVTVIATGLPGPANRVVALPRMVMAESPEPAQQPVHEALLAAEILGAEEIPASQDLGQQVQSLAPSGEKPGSSPDGYGYSPVISKAEWQTPAYLRRRSISLPAKDSPAPRLKRVASPERPGDGRFSGEAAVGRVPYRQPQYSLA